MNPLRRLDQWTRLHPVRTDVMAAARDVLLLSDGMPTDDFETAMARLLEMPWGARAVRMAVAIGQDADYETLAAYDARERA